MVSFKALILTVWVLELISSCESQQTRCQQGVNCDLPNCACPNYGIPEMATLPAELPVFDIPQIVAIAFDDAVNVINFDFYNKLFPPGATNPNGCPISATFFVSHNFTNYGMVKALFDRGLEIAAHSFTHRTPTGFWKNITRDDKIQEIREWQIRISRDAGIPLDKIYGWRSPFLQPSGDVGFQVLQELGFEYDSTLLATGRSANTRQQWPFTLDFGYPYRCQILPCPRGRYPGLWEVPVVPLNRVMFPCTYLDSCFVPPMTKEDTLDILLRNYVANYNNRREPLYINLHASFFVQAEYRLDALVDFINILRGRCDTYIVSYHQLIQWMKRPTSFDKLENFEPWQC